MKTIVLISILAASLGVQSVGASGHQKNQGAATPPSVVMTEGEVRKVDKAAKKITLKHGPIVNLDMPAMTMVFQVADARMLDQVKAGDKIKFAADKTGDNFMVTRIEKSPH